MSVNEGLSEQFEWAGKHMNAVAGEIDTAVIIPAESRKIIAVTLALDLKAAGVIFDGPPGVGKSATAHAAATAIGGKYGRVQGTPDLLPFDIIGSERPSADRTRFDWHPGPLASNNVVLWDEANRVPPRTQSAFLEAMQEGQVTVGNVTHQLPRPLRVIGTHNPEEVAQGTYPLTNAGLDRFLSSVHFDYLSPEKRIVQAVRPKREARQVVGLEDYTWAGQGIDYATVDLDDAKRVNRVITSLDDFEMVDSEASNVRSTRSLPNILLLAKGFAAYDGVQTVSNRNLDLAAVSVLRHRVALTEEAYDWGETGDHAVREAIGYSYAA